ncbi:MAG: hypothetical protein OXH75_28240 [Acidobacteria bacterium]|nr:hypothetical protein [Acidobacteriota bacterium]
MVAETTVADLKRLLRAEVGCLFGQDDRPWKRPIVEMLRDFRDSGLRVAVFGGTLRSLLYSRLYRHRPGRPRDVDLVIHDGLLRDVERRFREYLFRRTRFGGLQLRRDGWRFDVWTIDDTWAFRGENRYRAKIQNLPSTTPFNLEAIAVEAWPLAGRPREVFSGNDQFFEGILSKTVELNSHDDPCPALTIVRGLVLATEHSFRVGPQLAEYVAAIGSSLTESEFEEQQIRHYGHVRLGASALRNLIASIAKQCGHTERVQLPQLGQLTLWPTWPIPDAGCRVDPLER